MRLKCLENIFVFDGRRNISIGNTHPLHLKDLRASALFKDEMRARAGKEKQGKSKRFFSSKTSFLLKYKASSSRQVPTEQKLTTSQIANQQENLQKINGQLNR